MVVLYSILYMNFLLFGKVIGSVVENLAGCIEHARWNRAFYLNSAMS